MVIARKWSGLVEGYQLDSREGLVGMVRTSFRLDMGRPVPPPQDGMVWYGVVWYGMAWHCLVWYGMLVRYGY